jgi:hypothetical protein
MRVAAIDPRLESLRTNGVPVPAGGWHIERFEKTDTGRWIIKLAGDFNGSPRDATGSGTTIPEACARLAVALRSELRSKSEIYHEVAERAAASLREMPAWWQRSMCCDACNEGQHSFCSGCHSCGAAGCLCITLRPKSAKGHPDYR